MTVWEFIAFIFSLFFLFDVSISTQLHASYSFYFLLIVYLSSIIEIFIFSYIWRRLKK